MNATPSRRATPGSLAVVIAIAVLVGACVPQPAVRPTDPPTPVPSAVVTASPAPSGPSPSPSFVRPTATPLPTFLAITVRAGDTLSSIARTHRTDVASIGIWNRGTYPSLDPESEGYDPNRIEIGWVLMLMPGVVLDPTEVPDPSPSAAPSATPAATTRPTAPPATTRPSPTTAGESTKVSHGPRSSSMVALTFDMGGRLDPALDIMDWLIEHDVDATIFPTGKTASGTTVGRRVVELVAAHPERFDLGSHSWSHPDLRDLDAAATRDELTRTEDALVAIAGRSPKPWFRPPFGGVNATVLDRVGAAGYAYTVMWDIDTIDWRPEADGGPSAAAIVDKVVGNARGGSIVLMHLGGYRTFDALPEIVSGLRAKGLEPVTMSELLGI